ncbi:hypothetical protein [Actinomadura hibisca]|uniref:hypothetical protein n=1 Tax=Actinomadura hibisca TaxID=68565 RepID=UPI0008357238|nr:hypothetical protein [Actinomadura hibisca]
MRFAALVVWLVTAAAGARLLLQWLAGGGLRAQPAKVTRYPAAVLVGHPLSAVAGLALWVAYLVTGAAGFAWAAFGTLVLVIFQGLLLFTRWLVGGGGRHARGTGQALPGPAVLVHGVVALVTFVLVFLTALRAGGQ